MSKQGDQEMGRVSIEVELTNAEDVVRVKYGTLPLDQVRRVRMPGVVDPGATYLVIPESSASQLGVPEAGDISVRYADQRKKSRPLVENVRVDLLGRHGIFKAIVEPKREDVLIGAIVLEDLDLLVDCSTQTLNPRDPKRIITEIG
jgi:predicted aspartyl protease